MDGCGPVGVLIANVLIPGEYQSFYTITIVLRRRSEEEEETKKKRRRIDCGEGGECRSFGSSLASILSDDGGGMQCNMLG